MPKKLIEYIVKSLVEKPESVRIEEKQQDSRIMLDIYVDEKDRGKVIGRGGKTIRSIRVIAGLVYPDANVFIDIAK